MSSPYKTPPSSHPYIATITFDPANWRSLQRTVDERDELRLLGADQSEPDRWTAKIGCASRATLEDIAQWDL
jgi:hypothetical protein